MIALSDITKDGVSAFAAGGGGGVNKATQEVDFGVDGDFVQVTVAATWVNASSVIALTILPHLTDHDPEDVLTEELKCSYGNIVNGVSFDVYVFAPNGTHGRYLIKILGA